MTPGGELSREAESILRVLFRFRARSVSGGELMERLFATTSEVPLDPDGVCRAIRELGARGFVTLDATGTPDPDFDFSLVAITEAGREHLGS